MRLSLSCLAKAAACRASALAAFDAAVDAAFFFVATAFSTLVARLRAIYFDHHHHYHSAICLVATFDSSSLQSEVKLSWATIILLFVSKN